METPTGVGGTGNWLKVALLGAVSVKRILLHTVCTVLSVCSSSLHENSQYSKSPIVTIDLVIKGPSCDNFEFLSKE